MKKLVVAVGVLFLVSTLHAVVVVKQNVTEKRYASDASIVVDGSADTTVDYNGITVFIPKGTKAVLSPAVNKGLIITGNNMKGVQVYGMTLSSAGRASITVNRNSETISVRSGSVQAQNKAGQVATIARGTVVSANNIAALSSVNPGANAVVSIDSFVADSLADTNAQQASRNVKEEQEVLSPSAPR